MSTLTRAVVFLLLPLLLVAGVTAAGWYFWKGAGGGNGGPREDRPDESAAVAVPRGPGVLAWSPDGAYVAAATWGWAGASEPADPSEVYLVNVGKGSSTTAKMTGAVRGLAFSPDGKSLAVISTEEKQFGATPAVLVVFSVPDLEETFKAEARLGNFLDVAWAGDGKTLAAVDAPEGGVGEKKGEVRLWATPSFKEQEALRSPQTRRFEGVALSPDGATLAAADAGQGGAGRACVLRLFALPGGKEVAASKPVPAGTGPTRLAFTADGKVVGVFTAGSSPELSWLDVTTGKPATPAPARVGAQPAGLADSSNFAVFTPDGAKRARGETRGRGLGNLNLFGKKDPQYGSFVHLTETATGKERVWRVGEIEDSNNRPALAFSPDGTKLAVGAKRNNGGVVMVWAVPK